MNGMDAPKVFYIDANGDEHISGWGFTGENLNEARIIAGAVSKEFLWFIEKGTLKVWYTETAGNIAGTLLSFDLSQISKFGGELVAVANWTIDGGTGIDDLTAFITSEGEVLVYAGSNPNDAESWELKGSYKISKPIGYRCTMPYQGDIVIICQDGYFPMGKALASAIRWWLSQIISAGWLLKEHQKTKANAAGSRFFIPKRDTAFLMCRPANSSSSTLLTLIPAPGVGLPVSGRFAGQYLMTIFILDLIPVFTSLTPGIRTTGLKLRARLSRHIMIWGCHI